MTDVQRSLIVEIRKTFEDSIQFNAKPDFKKDILSTKHKIDDCANESTAINKSVVAVNDSYGNKVLSVGTDDRVASFTNYGFSNDTLNWTLWLALYNDSWVFKRAIDKPAQDMIRCGITLKGNNSKFNDVYRVLKKHRSDFIQLLQWGGLFGGSISVMMFDGMKDADYANPMNIEKLKTNPSITMYVVDRWYGVAPSSETVTDMKSIDFGKPAYYDVTLADGNTIRFHHDFVLRYEGRTAPKLIKNGMLQGWGYAEGSHILNELTRDDKLKASIQSLVDKALIEVIKMSGMRGVFMGAEDDNEFQLRQRLEMVNWGRSFNSLTFLDKDDEYEQNSFSGLAGLADLLQNNMWLIAAALEMQGVLFGDLKGGFSQDDEALERYDETINNRCETYLRPVYEKFIAMLYKFYDIDEKVEFTFNSLLMDKHDKERMQGMKEFVDLLSQMLADGVITAQQYAKAVQSFAVNGVIDFGLTDEAIADLKDKIEEEVEGIDL